ncbi:nitrate reductase [Notoacmeibacter sp. MSK16QG-6]|uniref:nitrate reductase n=1 Tax=Notoacmeibacter sp. MSK16QG-6 TaxID=2957982 RepID=UPI00209E8D19|nr:nitrate reductase [Notoacmeibacter sp. MSK16QG-6]MCP1199667.1 molybdopterin-dependent oxidoreductase [Notoacmeibacter sp. MSK16QG-6]
MTEKTTCTTCPYCGVGCGVLATAGTGGSVDIAGDPDHPANFGRLCSKGTALGQTVDLEGRLLYPQIGKERAGWDDALDLISRRFSETIKEHGPDSVAFYVSGQLLTEDYYVANKLMKGFIGSGNIDTNSRLCMASSVAGHRRAFGTDTVPGTYADLELADLIVLTGSNLAWCHPVLYQRIVAARERRPHMKVVLIDPRRTETASIADMHLKIAPDGDVALFVGLLTHLYGVGAVRQSYATRHVSGLDRAIVAASRLSMDALCRQTGLSEAELRAFYNLFARTERVVTVYSQGVNQSASGTDKVNAIINCHLATGRIGQAGMGPFSVTGQPNAMGGREVGGLANMLAAHMEIESESDRDRVQRFWNSPYIASRPGLKAVDLFDAVADGRIKALWIMGTNPVVSMPDADRVRSAIATCPFTVVSDVMAETDTTQVADVVLPSLAWGEKDGTVTNSERRISRQRGFLSPPGEAKADWWQLAEIGKRMGFDMSFAYDGPASIFAEHAALSAFENNGARDFDIGAYKSLDRSEYDAMRPFQWPAPDFIAPTRQTRFFANGKFFTSDGKARAIAVTPSEASASPGAFLRINTGRVRDQWHTMTRTAKAPRLNAHIAEPFCEIHPADAAMHGIEPAHIARLSNKRGEVLLRALITDRVRRGEIFVPMHWNDQFANCARIGSLIGPQTDPVSGQPALKAGSAELSAVSLARYGFAVSVEKPAGDDCNYLAVARTESGWRAEFALDNAPSDPLSFARALLLCPDAEEIGYIDAQDGLTRFAFFDDRRLVGALFLSPEPVEVSRNTVVAALGQPYDPVARWQVLAGRSRVGKDPGRIVCACEGVGINTIRDAVAAGCFSVESVGEATRAGTNCGSCRSEIASICQSVETAAAAE